MAKAKKNKLEIQCEVWARQKARPYPVGILEIVAAKLEYIGVAIRQRNQSSAQVAIATDRAIDYVGSNVTRAEAAFRRFAREIIKELGGICTSREETWYFEGIRYQALKADVSFEGIRYQDVYKRARIVFREAEELEEKLAAEAPARPRRVKRSKTENIAKPKEEKTPPALTTLPAPRLVRKLGS